jgi:hypothetical protein
MANLTRTLDLIPTLIPARPPQAPPEAAVVVTVPEIVGSAVHPRQPQGQDLRTAKEVITKGVGGRLRLHQVGGGGIALNLEIMCQTRRQKSWFWVVCESRFVGCFDACRCIGMDHLPTMGTTKWQIFPVKL